MPDSSPPLEIDYLIIGHVARDEAGDNARLGGTAAYAGVTARALGRNVGLVTSSGPGLDLQPLSDLELADLPSLRPTTFENRYEQNGRQQRLHALASPLGLKDVPAAWRTSPLIHLAPIAGEVDRSLVHAFPQAFLGVTAQGWLRQWDDAGQVSASSWTAIKDVLPSASAVVVSLEDLGSEWAAARAMAEQCRLLVVTDGAQGAMIFQRNEMRHVPAPVTQELDSTGAGDIFAAAFFINLAQTGDVWEAAGFATRLASASITVSGVSSINSLVAVHVAERQVVE